MGCICKELLARNLQPCCVQGRSKDLQSCSAETVSPTTSEKDAGLRVASEKGNRTPGSIHHATICASSKNASTCSEGRKLAATTPSTKESTTPRGCDTGTGACDTPNGKSLASIDGPPCSKTCSKVSELADGPLVEIKGCAVDPNPADACCEQSGLCNSPKAQPSGTSVSGATTADDIEKGALAVDHVSLSVEGLTCVGCETKLFRSLNGIAGVHNLNTSLVLSKAEFDLDDKAGTADEVIRAVETSTGFFCKRLNVSGEEVEILVDGDAKAFAERKYPPGITQLTATNKQTVRITYDPTIVGARTIVTDLFGSALKLAARRLPADFESGRKHVRHTAGLTLISATLTIPVLVLAWAPLSARPITYGAASLALATVIQFLIAGQFYISAFRALVFTRIIEMDVLIVLSTSTAYIFSIVAFAYQLTGRPLHIESFFETSTLLVTLIMLGRLVSAFARQKAVESVSLRSLQDHQAVLCDPEGGNTQVIDARLLQHGDTFKVGPDSRLTTDGVVVLGETEVDESMITGESVPVEKHSGSAVIAGSINGSGVIVVKLVNLPTHNTISTIAAMVDEAKFQKPKTQELVDVVASYFVPVILALTLLAFVVWIAVGVTIRNQDAGSAAVNAITYAVSVLVVSCPCAIGLCIPMVIVIAGGVGAAHGVIVKSALAVESARKTSHVVFDKTGTLTQGRLGVTETVIMMEERLALSITLGLTSNSKHPVSAAIASYCLTKGIDAATVDGIRSVTGNGLEGTLSEGPVQCGNTRWLSLQDLPEARALLDRGLTVVGVTLHGEPLALFGLSDDMRPEAKSVCAELKKRRIAVSVVSGDDAAATNSVASRLGIQPSNVRSRCTPADKQQYLKELSSKQSGTIIFCGDGTNDAVALAQADIGVHVSSGSEVAQSAADVVLVRPSLTGMLLLLDLSRAAMHRVFLNFAWSFIYNLFAILLAAGAFVRARIPPQYAGLGEIVSVLPVILVALQLRWFKREYDSKVAV
ncbi:hypothetical protein B0A50_08741 [Salinomyces thailandicus]|uniref:HMA domain-containing protein n=1 Tax=Salinomyces thailandicus TaxID=706561 RepID=A0A4V6WJL8_9PEZI|nr:hypothetical protein B0A50_08741 [Salinomyces thailandica]